MKPITYHFGEVLQVHEDIQIGLREHMPRNKEAWAALSLKIISSRGISWFGTICHWEKHEISIL